MNTRNAVTNKLKMIAATAGVKVASEGTTMDMLRQAYLAGVNATLDQLQVDREIANSVRKHTGAV